MRESLDEIRDFIGPMPLTVLVFDEEDCFFLGPLSLFLADNEDLDYRYEDLPTVGSVLIVGGGAAPLIEIVRCCPFCHDPNGEGTLDLLVAGPPHVVTRVVDCPRCPPGPISRPVQKRDALSALGRHIAAKEKA